jgi:hypothetical protein
MEVHTRHQLLLGHLSNSQHNLNNRRSSHNNSHRLHNSLVGSQGRQLHSRPEPQGRGRHSKQGARDQGRRSKPDHKEQLGPSRLLSSGRQGHNSPELPSSQGSPGQLDLNNLVHLSRLVNPDLQDLSRPELARNKPGNLDLPGLSKQVLPNKQASQGEQRPNRQAHLSRPVSQGQQVHSRLVSQGSLDLSRGLLSRQASSDQLDPNNQALLNKQDKQDQLDRNKEVSPGQGLHNKQDNSGQLVLNKLRLVSQGRLDLNKELPPNKLDSREQPHHNRRPNNGLPDLSSLVSLGQLGHSRQANQGRPDHSSQASLVSLVLQLHSKLVSQDSLLLKGKGSLAKLPTQLIPW